MVMWRVDCFWRVPTIRKVEVDRTTEKMVYFKVNGTERRQSRTSEHCCWFDSWDDAKTWCVQFWTRKVDYCKWALNEAEQTLAAVQTMEEGE